MHTIRLRGAWKFDGDRATRRFNRSTGLGRPGVRVWLVWDGVAARAELNGAPLDGSAGRHDVTQRLKPHNELAITGASDGLLASVRLEIEAE